MKESHTASGVQLLGTIGKIIFILHCCFSGRTLKLRAVSGAVLQTKHIHLLLYLGSRDRSELRSSPRDILAFFCANSLGSAGYSDSNECTDIRILKKSKQFHAKSRFGCTTCKKRRVKCDEGKPACLRCTNGGHECGGYDDLQEQKRKSMAKCGSVVLLPQFEDKHQILPVVTLSGPLSVTGSSEDQRSFDFFRSKTVHVLTGYFDNDFWKKLLLQISTSEPTVRHAILAVGALHEHYGIEHLESSHKNRQLALNHYIRAVKLLTGQDKHKKQSIEIIAVTCLLFACLELLLNDISGAIAHIRSGVLIIRSWKAKNNRLRRRLTGSDDIIQNYLAPAFDHMNLNSFVYSKTIALEHEYDNTEEFKHFETLFDARSALYNVR